MNEMIKAIYDEASQKGKFHLPLNKDGDDLALLCTGQEPDGLTWSSTTINKFLPSETLNPWLCKKCIKKVGFCD